MEIEQDLLCDYCKDKNEFPPNFLCEGGCCKESRKAYLEEHGITEDKTCFGHLSVGDSIFIIKEDDLNCSKIDSATETKEKIVFLCGFITVSTKYELIEDDDDGVAIFLNKKEAVKRYTELMTGKIIFMAETLAGIKDR